MGKLSDAIGQHLGPQWYTVHRNTRTAYYAYEDSDFRADVDTWRCKDQVVMKFGDPGEGDGNRCELQAGVTDKASGIGK